MQCNTGINTKLQPSSCLETNELYAAVAFLQLLVLAHVATYEQPRMRNVKNNHRQNNHGTVQDDCLKRLASSLGDKVEDIPK